MHEMPRGKTNQSIFGRFKQLLLYEEWCSDTDLPGLRQTRDGDIAEAHDDREERVEILVFFTTETSNITLRHRQTHTIAYCFQINIDLSEMSEDNVNL